MSDRISPSGGHMNYSWDIKDIEEKLENAVSSSENNKRFVIYQKMISDLKNASNPIIPKVSRDEFFENLNKFDISYFDTPFFNLVTYIDANIKTDDLELDNFIQERKNPSHTIKLCKDFYKKNDKDSYAYFKKIIKIPNIIHFTSNPYNYFLGRTYILSKNEFYMLINGRDYLEDSLSTIHETKHVEMTIKGYNNGISLYQELPSILYELYMIDYLSTVDENRIEVSKIRIYNAKKYLDSIKMMSEQIKLIKQLKNKKDSYNMYQNLYENYDLYYDEYHLYNLNEILVCGYQQKEIGRIISFIVAIDIYLNSRMSNVNNVLSCYMFGVYKMKPSMIDNILEYINSIFKPYQKDKINKKIKNGIDKI